jgi:hypothetical protein
VTSLQLRILVALSLLCTLVVFGAGLRESGRADASPALVAQRKPITVDAPGLGAQDTSDTSSSDDISAGEGSSRRRPRRPTPRHLAEATKAATAAAEAAAATREPRPNRSRRRSDTSS